MNHIIKQLALAGMAIALASAVIAAEPRQRVSLNGAWEVGEGVMDKCPTLFYRKVAVPGLIDMARPVFNEVGRPSKLRQAFWYRRTFKLDGPVPDMALLKIHKAQYGAKVWINGKEAGEHLPCFTPAWLKVGPLLKGNGEANEIVIRIGADRTVLPAGMPTGFDFEKFQYMPGIYDSVELILSGAPRIVNVQTVPDLARQAVGVVVEIEAGETNCAFTLSSEVIEAVLRQEVGAVKSHVIRLAAHQLARVKLSIPIENCHLWTPEDPFLYELKLSTEADALRVKFGMRTFKFDPITKRAMLNGKPYYLRGSNVSLYRFFEDADRGDLPWNETWVRTMHRKFKAMNWNALRYCIGFPPEFWYEIADEEGILIQDEFPIWLLGGKAMPNGDSPEPIKAELVIPEYVEWMRERWNHPCVVIWDAQNESSTAETGKALSAVRSLDLSQRPWENGWGEPQSPTDCVESHPYQFIRDWQSKKPFRMSEMPELPLTPSLQTAQKKLDVPIIINEYGWLWLNRKGEPTSLTDKVYANQLGTNSTAAQRQEFWAKCLAAKTEFWRAHRQCAGVLEFCSLGYSRRGDIPRPEGGATSDHWADVKHLVWEPNFVKYVRDAFNPVGIMLDFWAETIPPETEREVRVYVTNDEPKEWQGEVRLKFSNSDKTTVLATQPVTVAALDRNIVVFTVTLPIAPGAYSLAADLVTKNSRTITSRRDFKVVLSEP
ncbi:MAG: glycoside hydrolase family 2 TIM barrel-domain containing protein [Verrucomicrobiota bacterium]